MSSQRTDIPKQAPLAQFQPHNAQTHVFGVSLPATLGDGTNPAVQGPWMPIAPGSTITLRPLTNGNINSGPIAVGAYPEQLNGAGCFYLPASTDVNIPFTIDNLNQLWFAIPAGKTAVSAGMYGLSIVVTIPAVG